MIPYMKPLPLALALSILSTSSALAERFGSETAVTVQGVYYQSGETVSTTLANGDVRSKTKQTIVRVGNRAILEAMRDRTLIPTISGYRLVIVAHGHMADGVALFATKKSGTPIPVPPDLLSFDVSNGPATGHWVVDADALPKNLRQQTINQAYLTVAGGFVGNGLLNQAWTVRSVKNGDTTEIVELVSSGGSFTGALNDSPEAGVGTAQLTLSDPKIVDLTPYGMATIDTGSTGDMTFGGSLTVSLITPPYGGSAVTLFSGSTGGMTSGSFYLPLGFVFTGFPNSSTFSDGSVLGLASGATFSGVTFGMDGSTYTTTMLGSIDTISFAPSTPSTTSTLAINTTTGATLSGLVVDGTGTITQLPTFTGSYQPSKLIITTSSGTYTYTHDSNGVWTLVTS